MCVQAKTKINVNVGDLVLLWLDNSSACYCNSNVLVSSTAK